MLRRILMLSEVEMSVCECAYVFATVTWQSVIINRVERAHFILMSMEIGNQQPFLRLHTVLGVRSCIDLLYRLQLSLPFIRVYALCHSHLLQSLHLTLLTSYLILLTCYTRYTHSLIKSFSQRTCIFTCILIKSIATAIRTQTDIF